MKHQWVVSDVTLEELDYIYSCSECFLPMLDVATPDEDCPGIQDEQM